VRRQRKVYYNQAAMDFFVSYYCPEQEKSPSSRNISGIVEVPNEENSGIVEVPKKPGIVEVPSPPDKEAILQSRIDALQDELDALHAEIATLREQLEAKEAERRELLRQNGALILTLQQEKQEKQLFLPAPKKSFADKVKSIFKSKQTDN